MSIIEGSLIAVERYEKMLQQLNATPRNLADTDPTHLDHLLWMCLNLKENIRIDGKGYSVDKFSRHIGYIQGVLITKGHTTVREERDVTRPWFTPVDYSSKEKPKVILTPEEIARLNIPK